MQRFFKTYFFLFALMVYPFMTTSNSQAENINSTISVSATGVATAIPDMAVINLGVVTEDKTAQTALENNNKTMNALIDAFNKNGIDKKDLQTSNLSIYPINNDEKQKAKPNYHVSNSLNVQIRNLDDAGKIFDQAMKLGANNVSNIRFTNANTKPLYETARKNAVQEAMEKAKTLAEAANIKLGNIVSMSEENYSSNVAPSLMRAVQYDSVAKTNFESGELNYSVTVNITFSIAQ